VRVAEAKEGAKEQEEVKEDEEELRAPLATSLRLSERHASVSVFDPYSLYLFGVYYDDL
jgi:hypothetical protein